MDERNNTARGTGDPLDGLDLLQDLQYISNIYQRALTSEREQIMQLLEEIECKAAEREKDVEAALNAINKKAMLDAGLTEEEVNLIYHHRQKQAKAAEPRKADPAKVDALKASLECGTGGREYLLAPADPDTGYTTGPKFECRPGRISGGQICDDEKRSIQDHGKGRGYRAAALLKKETATGKKHWTAQMISARNEPHEPQAAANHALPVAERAQHES